MKTRIQTIVALGTIIFGLRGGFSIPIPALDVSFLTKSSDVVVVAEVLSETDIGDSGVETPNGHITARLVQCHVKVDSVLKGTIDRPDFSFNYPVPVEPVGYSRVPSPSIQILFLKQENGSLVFTDPYHASLPAVLGVPVPSGDTLLRVSTQLAAVLRPSGPKSWKQIALNAIATIRDEYTSSVLRDELNERDPTLRLESAAFLLLRNDLSGITIAESALTRPDQTPRYVLHNLAYAISEGVSDPKAVPVLTRLARMPDTEVRRAVASALGRTGDPSAIKALAPLLNDDDLEVRYKTVVGLANLAGQPEWGPNMDLYASSEGKYLRHWQDWISENRVSR